MSLPLNAAIIARVRGTETLSGRAAQAQSDLAALLAPVGSTNGPAIRYGAKGSSTVYPEITFREDAGTEPIGGPDIGIVSSSIYRFELWEQSRDGSTLLTIADLLEQLFDTRKDAPVLTLTGEGQCWASYLFTAFQGPFHADLIDVFYGLMGFRFIEARP